MRKIGINLHAKAGLSHESFIKIAADAGFCAIFTFVHPMSEQAEIARLCDKYAVECETLHAPFSHINDIWLDSDGGDMMARELMETIDHCLIAGAGIAVVHLSSGMNPPSITDIGRARFEGIVEYAAMKGVRIAFENQRMIANLAWALETFGRGAAGFCWDVGHEGCFTPGRRYMPLFGDRLICTHIQDNDGVFNEDRHYLPFDGTLDWKYVADTIRASGYTGSLMLEGLAQNSHRYDDITADEYIGRAADAMKRLRAMVDGE